MSFTAHDIENSNKFAEANHKIRVIKRLMEKAPHLASHLSYTKRAATANDYFVPAILTESAFVIDVQITEKLCTALSCNPATETGLCTPETQTSYYYLGTETYDVQCQPACWNTAEKQTYDEKGHRAPDTPMLNYHDGHCRLVNSSMVTYLEKPYYRSDTHYETRLNDMPTGFSRIKSDNPYGCGYDYRTNEQYCKYYDRVLEKDGSCGTLWWEKVLDAVVGMSLVNTVRSSIRVLSNGQHPFDLPTNLPALPKQLASEHTLEGWQANIDATFVVPILIDTSPRVPSNQRRRRKRQTNNENTPNDDDAGSPPPRADSIDITLLSPFTRRLMKQKPRLSKRSKRQVVVDADEPSSDDGKTHDRADWIEKTKNILIGLLQTITTDPNFWMQVGIGLATDKILDMLQALCKRIIERMTVYTGKVLLDIGEQIGAKVLGSAMKGVATRIVVSSVINLMSKTAVMLAKIVGAAASLVGWLLVASMIFDLLFTFWDPYGYNNLFPAQLPSDVMSNAEKAFRKSLESATCNYEFEHFTSLILSDTELIEIHLESLTDRLIYLDALVVNSEGTRIDKGNLINMRDGTSADMLQAQNEAMAKRVRFDARSYRRYNETFLRRTDINKYINILAVYSLTLAVATLVVGLRVIAVVLLIIALLVFYLSRLSLQHDWLLNAWHTLQLGRRNLNEDDTRHDNADALTRRPILENDTFSSYR